MEAWTAPHRRATSAVRTTAWRGVGGTDTLRGRKASGTIAAVSTLIAVQPARCVAGGQGRQPVSAWGCVTPAAGLDTPTGVWGRPARGRPYPVTPRRSSSA